jgi:hypothetical protein
MTIGPYLKRKAEEASNAARVHRETAASHLKEAKRHTEQADVEDRLARWLEAGAPNGLVPVRPVADRSEPLKGSVEQWDRCGPTCPMCGRLEPTRLPCPMASCPAEQRMREAKPPGAPWDATFNARTSGMGCDCGSYCRHPNDCPKLGAEQVLGDCDLCGQRTSDGSQPCSAPSCLLRSKSAADPGPWMRWTG